MDLTSAFKSEVFRPVVTLVVPGAVALTPYVLVLRDNQPLVSAFLEKYPAAFGVALAVAVVACGMVLEDLGARVEVLWDWWLKRKNPNFRDEWHRYLMLALERETIAQRYMRTVTLRLKFELSFAFALVAFWWGMRWLESGRDLWTDDGFNYFTVAAHALVAYSFFESYCSSHLLMEVRQQLVRKYASGPAAAALPPPASDARGPRDAVA